MSAEPTPLTPLQKAALAIRQLRARVDALEAERRAPIAIVGLGCRFPAGDGPEAFFASLRAGVDASGEVPPERWDAAELHDPDPEAPGRIVTRRGSFLDRVDGFDAAFFGITPREAAALDPQQRLLLEVSWEALEDAGIAADGLRGGDAGVFVGIGLDDYAKRQMRLAGNAAIDAYTGSGNGFCFASGRLSYQLGVHGPSLSVDTACSSSLAALHLACRSLRAGECRLALAAGVNLILSPEASIFLSRARALAPDGRSKAFSAAADGYGRGEGCGVVVLKRLADAEADGDRVLAVVRGTALHHDGAASGLTVPNGTAQQAVIRAALADAGVPPAAVGYVEAHGTGTALGDPIELRALAAVYGPGRPPGRPLLVGSVKSNVGHLETAAGMAGLVKVVESLRRRELPPSLHATPPTPHFDWDTEPLAVVTATTDWSDEDRRIAGISGFGLSGTIVHAVVEEAPSSRSLDAPASPERPAYLAALSALDETALAELAERHARHLESHPELAVADVAATLARGRAALPERLAVVTGATASDLATRLRASTPGPRRLRGRVGDRPPRVAFVFTGQGALTGPVGGELYAHVGVFRAAIDRCAAAIDAELAAPLTAVLFGDDDALRADTALAQPALFALAHALAVTWSAWGIEPVSLAGHSLGELVAAERCGVLGLADALALVVARGRLMATLPPGRMVAVAAGEAEVRAAIAPWRDTVAVAAVNGPRDVVVSGPAAEVAAAVAALERAGLRGVALAVDRAFHSPAVAAIEPAFAALAATRAYAAPDRRLVSTADGRDATAAVATPENWTAHLRRPVRFAAAVERLAERGFDACVEIGPRPALLPLVRRTLPGHPGILLPSLRPGDGELATMLAAAGALWVRGARLDWRALDDGARRGRPRLPTYPFQRRRHWFDERSANAPTAPVAKSEDGVDYRVAWLPAPAAPAEAEPAPGRWLLLADDGGVAAELARRLTAAGDQVVVQPAGEPLRRHRDDESTVPWRGIVHMGGLDATTRDDLPAQVEATLAGALDLVQSLLATSRPRPWLVTAGAIAALPGDELRLAAAPLWGLGRTVALERPTLGCGLVDLDPADPTAGLDDLVALLRADDHAEPTALRAGGRLRARLVREEVAPAHALPALRADGAYLVTGGLGDLGLAVAGWLVERGARTLVLAGRRPPAAAVAGRIEALRAAGATVETVAGDVARPADVARMVAVPGLPPLAGVVHAAGVTDDGLLEQQGGEGWAAVLAPKVAGAWNLHRATAGRDLDLFVLFSSVAAAWGSPGQASYAAANAFLDALAHQRRAEGLPALAVGWGPWGEIGLAARSSTRGRDRLAAQGLRPLAPRIALAALDRLVGRDRLASETAAHAIVAAVDWRALAARVTTLPALFAELVPGAGTGAEPWVERLRQATPERRRGLLDELLGDELERIAGLAPGSVEPRRSLFELGLDSLMALELRNGLEARLGVALPASLLFDYPSRERLVGFLASTLDEGVATRPTATTPTGPPEDPDTEAELDGLDRQALRELLRRELAASEESLA